MKKKTNFFILIILLIVISGLLPACNKEIITPINLETTLQNDIAEILASKYLNVSGTTAIDGEIIDEFNGAVNSEMSQAKIDINDISYYYFGKIRFSGNGNGISIVDYMSYNTLINQLGTTLLNFKFDSENISGIEQYGSTILVHFLGIGTQYSFSTANALSGGTLSLIYKDGKISKTILSTVYNDGITTHNYTNIASYELRDKLWDSIPKVLPTKDTKYANYLLTKLGAVYPSATFRLSSNTTTDTTAKVSDLIKDEKLISSVFVITNGSTHTITINYTVSQLVVGLSGSINNIEICYDDNYTLLYMFVNDGNKYILS